jgi:hypothetical protein
VKSIPIPSGSFEFIHKHPRIEMRQNEAVIYLLIAAADCQDYALLVDDSSLKLTINCCENRIKKAVIEFYSLVHLKLCSRFEHHRPFAEEIFRP